MSSTSELQFIENDAGKIYDFIMYILENGVSEELYPGDERKIFAEALVPLVVAIYSTLNDSAKQATLRYARGKVLEALGEFCGVYRMEAKPATTTIRFSLNEVVTQDILIGAGTRVTSDYTRYFSTVDTVTLKAGNLFVDVEAESTENGIVYNGIQVGEINVLVDKIPFIDTIENLSKTEGAEDEEEDENMKERIRLSHANRSTAGSLNAYKYYALSSDTSIADVNIDSPSKGVVRITPVLYGGKIPGKEILDKVLECCSADDVRPLTDKVEVVAPDIQSYDIELVYYTTQENESEVVKNIEGEGGAVEQYIYWQGSALDRNINPDYLRKLILSPKDKEGNYITGADRVLIISPQYLKLNKTTVAKFSGNLKISHEVEE